MNEEAQGHDHSEHEEEADGQADEDLAKALLPDGVEAVDGEHHDGQDDGNRQHARVEQVMRLERTWYDNGDSTEDISDGDDDNIANKINYFSRFRINASLHNFIPFLQGAMFPQ